MFCLLSNIVGNMNTFEVVVHFGTNVLELGRYYVRHIYPNFRLTNSSQKLKNLFWKASRSCTVYDFNNIMDEIKAVDNTVRVWLEKIDVEHWSRHAFDNSIKCDNVTNNMTESFNNMLKEHKAKTYLCLLEHIRRIVMKMF
ncbi:hypothetical protein ACOSP7_021438 [Xanthoceras sorbifolium]